LWFFFSSRRRHTRCYRDWSSDVCSSDLLAGARAGLRAAPKEVDTALVAYMATYNDLMWVLDDAEQALLLRLRPRAFDGDRGQWEIGRASCRERVEAWVGRVTIEGNMYER